MGSWESEVRTFESARGRQVSKTLETPWGVAYGLCLGGLYGLAVLGTIWTAASGTTTLVLTIGAVLVTVAVMLRAFAMGAVVTPTHLKIRRVLTTRTILVGAIDAISVGNVDGNPSTWAPRVHTQGGTVRVRSLAGYGFGGEPNSRVVEQARTMAQVLNVAFDEELIVRRAGSLP
jgi:hypothetical protein